MMAIMCEYIAFPYQCDGKSVNAIQLLLWIIQLLNMVINLFESLLVIFANQFLITTEIKTWAG